MSCPCDKCIHPPRRVIKAGLTNIPRQIAGFPEFRRAMLADLKGKTGLTDWRADSENDLGVMLLEMWAYVCDVLGFYDENIAHECYLRTARLRPSLRKLVGLIGYLPRPAVAANAHLAAFAEGRQPVKIPAGTAFRSGAFDGNPPQVFESDEDTLVHPFFNQWTIRPPKKKITYLQSDHLLLEPDGANIKTEDLLLIRIPSPYFQNRITRIDKVTFFKGEDGHRYCDVLFDRKVNLPPEIPPESFTLLKPTQIAGVKQFVEDSQTDRTNNQDSSEKTEDGSTLQEDIGVSAQEVIGHAADVELSYILRNYEQSILQQSMLENRMFKAPQPSNKTEPDIRTLTLDGMYRDIRVGDTLIISGTYGIKDFRINRKTEVFHELASPYKEGYPATLSLFTNVTLDGSISSLGDLSGLKIHYGLVEAGKIALEDESVLAPGRLLNLLGPVEKPADGKSPTLFQLKDKNKDNLEAGGNLRFSEKTINLDPGTEWKKEFLLPVQVYANIIKTTRGESVTGEILGSGDASIPNQTFMLKKKPLTYLSSPTAENDSGVVSTLVIHVDGIRWVEVPSFFHVQGDAQVYIIRQDDEGNSIVKFGDGRRGSRLPTGRGNVIADYRYGAGAASPPANTITQLTKPVKGIKSIRQPVAAFGGDDAELPESLRLNAPGSALILGRAVSLDDLEAVASGFPGVRDVSVRWDWNKTRQGPVVQVWYIGESGIEAALEKRLKSMSDPTTEIDVLQAGGKPVRLSLSIEIDPRYRPEVVLAQVRAILMNPGTGLLSPERIGIGKPLYRSRIFETVLSVRGVVSVHGIHWDDAPFDVFAKHPGKGNYFDLKNGTLEIRQKDKTGGR